MAGDWSSQGLSTAFKTESPSGGFRLSPLTTEGAKEGHLPKLWEVALGRTNGHTNRAAAIQPPGKRSEREKAARMAWQKARGKGKRNREAKRGKGKEVERNEDEW